MIFPAWLATAATHILGYEGVRTMLGKVGEVGAEQFKKLLDERDRRNAGRALLLQEMRNPAGADILTARLKRAEETGEPVPENDVIKAISRLLPLDKDEQLDEDGAVEVLNQLAAMEDQRFGALMSAMQHNVIAQQARLFLQRYGVQTFTVTFAWMNAAAEEIAAALEQSRNRLHREANQRGWRSWGDC